MVWLMESRITGHDRDPKLNVAWQVAAHISQTLYLALKWTVKSWPIIQHTWERLLKAFKLKKSPTSREKQGKTSKQKWEEITTAYEKLLKNGSTTYFPPYREDWEHTNAIVKGVAASTDTISKVVDSTIRSVLSTGWRWVKSLGYFVPWPKAVRQLRVSKSWNGYENELSKYRKEKDFKEGWKAVFTNRIHAEDEEIEEEEIIEPILDEIENDEVEIVDDEIEIVDDEVEIVDETEEDIVEVPEDWEDGNTLIEITTNEEWIYVKGSIPHAYKKIEWSGNAQPIDPRNFTKKDEEEKVLKTESLEEDSKVLEDVEIKETIELDPLFEEAARLLFQSWIASTSALQRKLNLGYIRAGKIIDQLETAGIVWPTQGAQPRAILISSEEELSDKLATLLKTEKSVSETSISTPIEIISETVLPVVEGKYNDIESQKDDIERRRQEELNFYTRDEFERSDLKDAIFIGDSMRIQDYIPDNQCKVRVGEISEDGKEITLDIYYQDGKYKTSLDLRLTGHPWKTKIIREQLIWKDLDYDTINDKYDAELEALNITKKVSDKSGHMNFTSKEEAERKKNEELDNYTPTLEEYFAIHPRLTEYGKENARTSNAHEGAGKRQFKILFDYFRWKMTVKEAFKQIGGRSEDLDDQEYECYLKSDYGLAQEIFDKINAKYNV